MRLRFVPTITLCFNPRTRVGCDFLMRRSRLLISGFNPRTRVGCDQCVCVSCLQLHCVSIHAPAWGATTVHRAVSAALQGFNPRTRVGCDVGRASPKYAGACFNPRTRVGCDSPPTNRIFAAQEFQSTHPRGVRLAALLGLSIRVTVSIHAPAWGATTSIWQARNSRPVSIHAPAWGATCRHVRQRACLRVSIHAPAWGATLKASGVFLLGHCFNPRTRVGCDGRIVRDQLQGEAFQSTHPRGVRLFPCFIQ